MSLRIADVFLESDCGRFAGKYRCHTGTGTGAGELDRRHREESKPVVDVRRDEESVGSRWLVCAGRSGGVGS